MKLATLDIIFIQETKCSIQKLKKIHSKWMYRFEFLEVKEENTVGDIFTLWNPHRNSILDADASRNYLSVIFKPVRVVDTLLATNVYGP